MSFFYILKGLNLDWSRAVDVFYNLTDLQVTWLNHAGNLDYINREKDRDNQEDEIRKKGNNTAFGGNTSVSSKKFNLKGD